MVNKNWSLFLIFNITFIPFVFAQRPAQGPMSTDKFNPVNQGYSLVWEDEFNGSQLDTLK